LSGKEKSDQKSENESIEENQIDNNESSPSADETPVDLTPEQQIEALEIMVQQAQEDVLRAKAEEQNSLRRASLDVDKARKYALESFVKELLPVVDNLERALSSIDMEEGGSEAVVEGVELTLKTLLAALEKNRVQAIDPEGESFNPEQHQAMAMVENADIEPNSVIEVFQKGYELNGRLIRPAMVVVSKSK
jgi:molecular chaperone GrpE